MERDSSRGESVVRARSDLVLPSVRIGPITGVSTGVNDPTAQTTF